MQNRVSIETHKVLFKEGEKATKLFVIKKGEVLCLKWANDRLIPVFLARPGDVVGESAMVDGALNVYSAVTHTSVEVIEVAAENFKSILKEAPEWLAELTSTMILRFQNTAQLVADNRIIHSSILSEEEYPSSLEVQLKRLVQ